MSFGVGFAQDMSGDSSIETAGNGNTTQTTDNVDTSTEPTGIGDNVQAADNLNVSA